MPVTSRKELKAMTEAELVKEVLAGHSEAFGEIFARHRERAFGLAFQYLRNREEAKDAVQDSFIKAFQNLKTFNIERDFGAWFMTIVRNRAIDLIRRRKKVSPDGLPPVIRDPRAIKKAESGVVRSEIWEALEQLSTEHREIVFLKDYQGHSYREIAEILEIPLGTVMSRLHHARRNLAARLKGE